MARSPSWMGLLAALTLGASAGVVRAEIRALQMPEIPSNDATEELRLVVQSYAAPAQGRSVPRSARPLGSRQQSVTAEQLRRGLVLDVPCFASSEAAPLVVAWVERGRPDLAFDGRKARPRRGSVVGYARGAEVTIQLTARSGSARSTRVG